MCCDVCEWNEKKYAWNDVNGSFSSRHFNCFLLVEGYANATEKQIGKSRWFLLLIQFKAYYITKSHNEMEQIPSDELFRGKHVVFTHFFHGNCLCLCRLCLSCFKRDFGVWNVSFEQFWTVLSSFKQKKMDLVLFKESSLLLFISMHCTCDMVA